MLRPVREGLTAALVAVTLTGGGACDGTSPLEAESQRVWGRDRLNAKALERAKDKIPVGELARPGIMHRVLSMPWAEVVARAGLIRYEGVAKFKLSRNNKTFSVTEDTLIEQGLYGSWRVLQKDAEGAVLRETFFHDGAFYLRNGPGALRRAGIKNPKVPASREEAWEPLSTFTRYFGARLGLRRDGTAPVPLGRALRYRFVLLEGPEYVEVGGMKGKKKPVDIKGHLWVLESSGVVAKARLFGALEIPPPGPMQPPGTLRLALSFTLRPDKERELRPENFIPTIARRPVDLDPLAFLDGGTRTSTVIGGKR